MANYKEFDIATAKKIVEHYEYLKGKPLDLQTPNWLINAILIVPNDMQRAANLMSAYHFNKNNDKLLIQQGFNPSKVYVFVVSFNTNGNKYYNDIEKFLKKNNIERIYELTKD